MLDLHPTALALHYGEDASLIKRFSHEPRVDEIAARRGDFLRAPITPNPVNSKVLGKSRPGGGGNDARVREGRP